MSSWDFTLDHCKRLLVTLSALISIWIIVWCGGQFLQLSLQIFLCVWLYVHLQPKSSPKPYKMAYLNCHFALTAQCCILKQRKILWADPTSLVQSTVIHWYFGFQSFSQEMQDLSAHGSEYKAWGPCRVLSPVPTATHNHVTEVKSKKAALHVILKYNSHSLQTSGFCMTVPKPYFIYHFNADISSFNCFLYRLFLPNHTTCKGMSMAQATYHGTSKYWNEPVKCFLFNLKYITFELKLSTAESVITYLIQLNAKCFWMFFTVLQKTKNITLTFSIFTSAPSSLTSLTFGPEVLFTSLKLHRC